MSRTSIRRLKAMRYFSSVQRGIEEAIIVGKKVLNSSKRIIYKEWRRKLNDEKPVTHVQTKRQVSVTNSLSSSSSNPDSKVA